jgi:hypothetical protein
MVDQEVYHMVRVMLEVLEVRIMVDVGVVLVHRPLVVVLLQCQERDLFKIKNGSIQMLLLLRLLMKIQELMAAQQQQL